MRSGGVVSCAALTTAQRQSPSPNPTNVAYPQVGVFVDGVEVAMQTGNGPLVTISGY